MTIAQIKDIQETIGVEPDGFWGRKSIEACQAHLRALRPAPSPSRPLLPLPNTDALIRFYGQPGDESNLVNLPVQGVKYAGKPVKSIRCHRLCAETLSSIIEELRYVCPSILEKYDGCYNYRKMRGGSSWSMHAWGAAIDFDAANNGNGTHWPTKATMPLAVMQVFAEHGWLAAGAFWGRDAMHFQMTR